MRSGKSFATCCVYRWHKSMAFDPGTEQWANHTLRKVALKMRGMQVAAGILYSQVPSVMRRPVSLSTITSSLVNRPSPWMNAPSTCSNHYHLISFLFLPETL